MKNSSTVFIALFFSFGLFAQKEYSCSNYKSHHALGNTKSNTLSVADINRSEQYDVHYYKLDVALERTSTDIAGTVEMQASVRTATLDSVLFELFPTLAITEIRLNGTPTPFTRNNTAVTVPVNLIQGQHFSIEVDYAGTPPTQQSNPLGGSGMTNDTSPSWGNQVTWSLSEAFVAYEWFPCKQSLRDKIDSSDVFITTDNTNLAGSNGVLKQIVDLGNGKHRFEWESRHKIDYYLISVAVAQYIDYSYYAHPSNLPGDSVLIQNYIYNNPGTLTQFQVDINQTGDFIEYFSELYGLYPFWDEKYGHCMAPISGGMEHQTMTTQGFFEKTLTVHEMGHQWFGDMVTCSSWADIWVNEGFASFTEFLMFEHFYPTQAANDMQTRHTNVMSAPGGSVWCLDSLHDASIFSSRLVYDKGGAIIETMRSIVNDDTVFFNGLRNYLAIYKDSTASGLDVKSAMEATSGLDLTNFFQEWYFGEGFPTYSAKWNQIGNQLIIRLSQTASAPTVTPLFTTPVELKFSRTSGGDTTIRMNISSASEFIQIPMNGTIIALSAIDPNNYIINKVGSITKDATLSLGENKPLDDLIQLYPNPTSGPLNIVVPAEGDYEVTILNAAGQLVQQTTIHNSSTIQLNENATGYFMIQIKDMNGNLVRRKIIKR